MGKRYDSVKDMVEDMYSYKGKSRKWERRREKKHKFYLRRLERNERGCIGFRRCV